jgi:hypothetical protein
MRATFPGVLNSLARKRVVLSRKLHVIGYKFLNVHMDLLGFRWFLIVSTEDQDLSRHH